MELVDGMMLCLAPACCVSQFNRPSSGLVRVPAAIRPVGSRGTAAAVRYVWYVRAAFCRQVAAVIEGLARSVVAKAIDARL